jgi:hypothetical protein
LNSIRLVLLSMWFGIALFFGAVVAPAAFSVLRSFSLPNASEIAGSIVNRSLGVVNVAGVVVALLLLITLFIRSGPQGRIAFVLEAVSLIIVIVTTAVGHWVIAARMRALRVAMAIPIDQVSSVDPRRVEFNSLHGYSVKALGLAMIATLIAMVLISRKQN